MDTRYTYELWHPNGQLLADLSGLATSRRVALGLNEADDVTFDLDLDAFEAYCRRAQVLPSVLLQVDSTEVRVKRGSTYLAGGQIVAWSPDLDERGARLNVRATGFLNLFADRYTASSRVFNNVPRANVASMLVSETQGNGTDWNFGVVPGALPSSSEPYSITYQNASVKQALQDLTRLRNGIDIQFTPDKVFNIYNLMGSQRPDVEFNYPGNIKRLGGTKDGTAPANTLYLYGRGTGDSAGVYTQRSDTVSQKNIKVREKLIQLSDVIDTGTLADYGDAQLAAWGKPFFLPQITVSGSRPPYLTDFGIGDYVKVRISGYELLSETTGMFRVIRIEAKPGNDGEEELTLTLSR